MMLRSAVATLVCFPMCLLFTETSYTQSLNEQSFQKLHAEINPGQEDWKSIPWQTDLLKAQRIAAESKKPLFIWAMDGHPLGCT